MTSSRFTVAIHVLTLLAQAGEGTLTSEYMAGSVNTNPVVIRRILADLRLAKLVASQGGAKGGWHLLRPAAAITLRDVHRAIEAPQLFALHSQQPNVKCPVGRHIQALLTTRYAQAQQVMEDELATSTIADLLADVERRGA